MRSRTAGIGADHRLIVFSAGGATVRRSRGRIICTMLKCPPRKAMPCAVVAARVVLLSTELQPVPVSATRARLLVVGIKSLTETAA
jgi:hypothetical protein